ncbi:MAG: DUF58 domain-containing protein [Chloroflexi bacterium]|nr:DUF58 domain-containing protein [Chloroflexota bacterium]
MSMSFLEQYRLRARRHVRPHLVGGHITRRMGQSLEFQEYARYTIGDDVRHIDWRASVRTMAKGSANYWEDLLVRKFMAEEHLKLVVSIDTRETMTWPRPLQSNSRSAVNISKLQVARWLAEALSIVALRAGDRVVLHPLFGTRLRLHEFRGTNDPLRIRPEIDRVAGKITFNEQFNASELDRCLPPASVWIILTDFYFGHQEQGEARRLLHRIKMAKDKMRWVILVDLDSWRYEQFTLGRGARAIFGPGTSEKRLVVTDDMIASVGTMVNKHKHAFLSVADHTIWSWDARSDLHEHIAEFFKARFVEDRLLQRLFMRDV